MSESHEVLMYLAERQNYAEVRKFGDVPEELMARGYIPEAFYMKTENWHKLGEPTALEITIKPTTPIAESTPEEENTNG